MYRSFIKSAPGVSSTWPLPFWARLKSSLSSFFLKQPSLVGFLKWKSKSRIVVSAAVPLQTTIAISFIMPEAAAAAGKRLSSGGTKRSSRSLRRPRTPESISQLELSLHRDRKQQDRDRLVKVYNLLIFFTNFGESSESIQRQIQDLVKSDLF